MIQPIIWLLTSIRYWEDMPELPWRSSPAAKDPTDHYFLNHPIPVKSSLYNSNLCCKSQLLSLHLQKAFEVEDKAISQGYSPDAKLPSLPGFLPTIFSFPVPELFLQIFNLCQNYSGHRSDRIQTMQFQTVLFRTFKLTWLLILKCQVYYITFFTIQLEARTLVSLTFPSTSLKHRFIESCFLSSQFLTVCWSSHTT